MPTLQKTPPEILPQDRREYLARNCSSLLERGRKAAVRLVEVGLDQHPLVLSMLAAGHAQAIINSLNMQPFQRRIIGRGTCGEIDVINGHAAHLLSHHLHIIDIQLTRAAQAAAAGQS